LILPILPNSWKVLSTTTRDAAADLRLFGTAWAVMQFFFSPVLGACRTGSAGGRGAAVDLGLALDYVLMALAPSLPWLFVGRVISGITSASVSTAFAYIRMSRLLSSAQRVRKVGVAFAPVSSWPGGRRAARRMDPRLPFWVAAGLSFAKRLRMLNPAEIAAADRRRRSAGKARSAGALHLLRSTGCSRAVGGELPAQARMWSCLYLRALCDLSIWLGHNDGRSDTGHGRHLLNSSAGCCDRADGAAFRRAPGAALGLGCGAVWLSDLRRGADWPAVLARHTRDGVYGASQAPATQALTTQLSRRTSRAAARCDQ